MLFHENIQSNTGSLNSVEKLDVLEYVGSEC